MIHAYQGIPNIFGISMREIKLIHVMGVPYGDEKSSLLPDRFEGGRFGEASHSGGKRYTTRLRCWICELGLEVRVGVIVPTGRREFGCCQLESLSYLVRSFKPCENRL